MKKTIIGLSIIGLIGLSAYLLTKEAKAPLKEVDSTASGSTGANSTSGMRAEENMVVVAEQRPGKKIIAAQYRLTAPGFIVIHADKNGEPGEILGASSLLAAGEGSQVSITLSRESRNGEKLHVMLHNDTNTDGTFNSSTDLAVQSSLGGTLGGWFDISIDAPLETIINI